MAKKKFINQLYRKNKSSMVTSKMLQEQSVNAILADSENRTLWINGSPYGNAYVKPDTNNNYDRLDPSNKDYGPIHAEIFNDFDNNTAEGDYSHAEGKGTQTYNEGEHAEGKYNYSIKSEDIEIDELDTDAKKSKGTISTIGIGTNEENRKNAFRVDNSGEVYIVGVESTLPDGRKVSYDPCNYDGTKKTVETRSLQEVIQGLGTMQEVTYGELRTLIDNKRLVPGMQYRITDYANNSDIFTEDYKNKFEFAANQFDIIVVADSEDTLNKNARACKHDFENDIYKIANNIIFSNIDINNILDNELLNEHPEYILSYENYLKYNESNETIKSQYPNEIKLIYNNINNQVESLKVKDSYFDFSDMNQWKLQYNINVDNIYYKNTVNNSKIILNVTLPDNTYEIREYVFESNVNILYKEKQYLYKWRISKYQKANNNKQYDFLYDSENEITDVKPFNIIDNNKIFNEDYDKILLTSLQYPSKENTGDILVCEDEQLYSVDNLFNNTKRIKIGKQYYNEELILFSLQNNFVNNYFDVDKNKFDENKIINQTNQSTYNFLYSGPVFYNGKQVHKWYKVKLSNGFTNNEDIEAYNNVLYNNYEVRNFQKEIDNINGYEYYTYVLSEELTPLYKGDLDAVNNYNSQRFIYSYNYEGSEVNYNSLSTENNKIDGSFEKINYNNIDYSYNDFYNTANSKYYYDTAGAPAAKGIWNINKNTDGSYNIEINKGFSINTKFIENKLFREYVNTDLNNKLWLGEGSRFIVNYCYMTDTNNVNNAITIFYKPENYIGDDYPIHYQCNKSYIYSKNVNNNGNITTQYYSVWEIQGVNINENLSNNIILIGGPNGYFKSVDEVNRFNNNLTIDTLKQCFGSYKNDTNSKVYLVNIVDTVNSINFIDMLKPIQTTSSEKQLFKYKYLKFSSILNNKVTFDYFNNPKNIDNTNKKLFLTRIFKDDYISYPKEPIVTDIDNTQYFPNNNTAYKALDLFYNNYKYKNIFNTNYKYYDQVNKENINNFEILSKFTDDYNIYISVKETSETINIFNYFDKDYLVKGIITYLEDEFNNICQYDFKNIKFGLELTNLDLEKIKGLNDKDNNIGVEAQSDEKPIINNFYYTYSEVYNNIVKDSSVNNTYNIINNKIIYNNSNNSLPSNIFINSNIINNIIVNCDNLTIHQIDLSTNSFINCKKELKTSISNDFYYINSNIIWNKGYFYINNNKFNNCSDITICKEYDSIDEITNEIKNIEDYGTIDNSLLINIENNSINEYNNKIINKNLYNSLLFNNSNINYYTIDSNSIDILSENNVNINTENDVNINTKHNVNIDTENDVNINSNNTNVLSTTKYNKFTALNKTNTILDDITTSDNGIEGQSVEIVSNDDKKIYNSKKLNFSYSSDNTSESNLNFKKLSRYTVSEYDEDEYKSKVYYPNAGGVGNNSYDNSWYISPYHYLDTNYNKWKDISNVKKITFTQPLITITNKNIIGDKNNYLFSYLDINDLHTENFIKGFKEYINEASISFVNYYYGWNKSDNYSEPLYCVSNIKYKISYTILYNKIEYNAKDDLFTTPSCEEVIGSFDLNNVNNKLFMTTISSSNERCFNGIIAINSLKYVNNIEDIITQKLNNITNDDVKIKNNNVNIVYYKGSKTYIKYVDSELEELTYEKIKSKAGNGVFEFYVPSEIKFKLETSLDDVGYSVQLGKQCYDYFISNQIYSMPNSKIEPYKNDNQDSTQIDNAYYENYGVLFKKLYNEDHSTLNSQRNKAIKLSTLYKNGYNELVDDNTKNNFSYNNFISKLLDNPDNNIKENPFYLTQRKLTNESADIIDTGKNGVYTGNNGIIVFNNSIDEKGEIYDNYIRLFFNEETPENGNSNGVDTGVPCIAYKYGSNPEVVKGLPDLLNLLQ